MAAAPSPAEMNRRHREFWDVESQVFERRLADPQLVAAATEDMNSEILRRVPWNWPLRMPGQDQKRGREQGRSTQEGRRASGADRRDSFGTPSHLRIRPSRAAP